jgi:hypothetical protein
VVIAVNVDSDSLSRQLAVLSRIVRKRVKFCDIISPLEVDNMSFVSITTWRMTSETETLAHVTELMQQKYFPGLLALGAKHSMLMDAELDRFAIVTVYPSREVRDDALNHISELRIKGAEEFGAELMDAYAGEVLAASDYQDTKPKPLDRASNTS